MTEFVAVYHPETRGLGKVPEELVDHWGQKGWRRVPGDVNLADADAVEALLDGPPAEPELPAKSAKAEEWRAYAVAQGMDAEEAEATTRADLIDRFTPDTDNKENPA